MKIAELQNKLLKKEISAKEIVTMYLKNIKDKNPIINAYLTVDEDGAYKDAEKIDKLIAENSKEVILRNHPLIGVPIAHKDIISTENIRTTASSKILDDYVPVYDATVVKKLKDAGTILLGKLNCDAFAHGASGHNSDYGDTKNPYDLDRIPGGSSSGSGAAIASDLAIAATGTDTGGSIRNPAAWCNAVGLKPTYGRVSRYGVIAMASSLDSIGHITKTVEDNALILNSTAGFDPKDATSSKLPVDDYLRDIKKGIKGLKIGIPMEYFSEDVDQDIRDQIIDNIQYLKSQGAQLVDVSLPNTKYALAVYYVITPSEVSSNLGRFDGIRYGFKREAFGDEAKRRIMIGTYVLSEGYYDAYYLQAQKVRHLITQDFKRAFEKVDVLIAPITPTDPLKIGEDLDDPLKMYMIDVLSVTANLAGIPSLSVPAGFSKNNLPIGMQIMGKHFDEKTLYQVGYAVEQKNKFYLKEPVL